MERNMYLDKEKAVKAFMGTGEKNAAGEDLVTFLEKYDPHKYQNPCNTVDMAVFAYNESEKKVTKVLLIQRGNHPSIGWWALPGGFVEYRENLETAAARELQEETGIEHLSFEQLKEGLEENDGEKAFRAAHTLKGVCLNLGFNGLNKLSSELTEKLRGHSTEGTEPLFEAVKEKYESMIETIRELQNEG